MKYCPTCERRYDDEMRLCGLDGTALELVREEGSNGDRYIGKTIKGRYQVIRRLGEGGMGTVYLAEQISMARKVALKILQGNYAVHDEFIDRFRREARLAASLNHPYIVTVYDFDQADDGTLFIALEFVNGKVLTDVIQRDGPLDIGRAVRLGAQIAEGLEVAHRNGVIHRDIKPDNIMVVGAGESEKVKLMDFGIARLRDSGPMNRLTRAGVVMGTPAYMAPEQAEGAEVTERTDIYALGIVLYEMLSGSVPFRASTPGAVLVKQIQEMPLPLRNLRREVPASIERVVMQALEKKPENRQREMREVVQGLNRLEQTIVEEPRPRPDVVGHTAAMNEVPRTIAATQILQGQSLDKITAAKSKYLALGLIGVIAIVGLVFGVAKLGDRPLDVIKKKKSVVMDPVTEPVNAPAAENSPMKESAAGEPSRIASETSTRVSEPADVTSDKPSLKKKSPIESKTKDRISSQKPTIREGAPDERKLNAEPAPDTSQSITKERNLKPEPGVTQKPTINAQILDYIRVAQSLRERGDYQNASKELEKARAIDPTNKVVHEEIERTRKACNAEKQLMSRLELRC